MSKVWGRIWRKEATEEERAKENHGKRNMCGREAEQGLVDSKAIILKIVAPTH